MDKKSLTFVLLSSFFLVAVFGFMGMGHSETHEGGCMAALSRGVSCPSLINPLAAVQLHLNVFKSFSTAIFEIPTLSLLLALTLLILAAPPLDKAGRILADIPDVEAEEDTYDFLPPVSQRIRSWLSLYEHSSTLLFRRG